MLASPLQPNALEGSEATTELANVNLNAAVLPRTGRDVAGHIDQAAGSPHATNLAWLLKLRWGAAAGKLTIILLVRHVLGIALPLQWILPILGLEVATNGVAWL